MEVNSITDVDIYWCEFHREQAWTRWTGKAANVPPEEKEDVLRIFRQLAHSATVEEFNEACVCLHESEFWSDALESYMDGYWLPRKEVGVLTLHSFKQ